MHNYFYEIMILTGGLTIGVIMVNAITLSHNARMRSLGVQRQLRELRDEVIRPKKRKVTTSEEFNKQFRKIQELMRQHNVFVNAGRK